MAKRRQPELPNRTRVRVSGSVGDDATGDLRGQTGHVLGVNATYEKNGRQFVNVQLEGGAVVSMPRDALKVRD